MDIRALLADFARESPMLGACLLLIVLSARYLAKQHAKHLSDLRAVHRDTMKMLRQSNENLTAALRAQLRQLEKDKRDAEERIGQLLDLLDKPREP